MTSNIENDRWNTYMFELERIAAALHCTGLDFRHYIDMCALAWNITGQRIDLTLIEAAKQQEMKQ